MYVCMYVWRKVEKMKSKFDEFIMKVNVECFGYKNLLQDLKFMQSFVKIVVDVWWKEIFITVFSAFCYKSFFSPAILSNIYHYFNNSFNVLNNVIITKTFNVDFHYKFNKFGSFCFFYFSLLYIYIYIFI